MVETGGSMSTGDTPPVAPTPAGNDRPHDLVRLAIPGGVALIIAIFVALGIEGDVFSRLMRNSPERVAWAFNLAIIGVALPLLLLGWKRRFTDPAAGVVLVLASSLALWIGVTGFGEREQ